jgi:DNA-binding NtrC family response regulator
LLTILCLEDNEILRSKFCRALNEWHFAAKVFGAASIAKADQILKSNHIDIFLADLNVEDGDATRTIQSFSKHFPDDFTLDYDRVDSEILVSITSGTTTTEIALPSYTFDAE